MRTCGASRVASRHAGRAPMSAQYVEVLRSLGIAGLLAAGLGFLVVAWLAWLAGLAIVLRGSKPTERAEILRAYGAAQPHFSSAAYRRSRETNTSAVDSSTAPDGSAEIKQSENCAESTSRRADGE
jgi:hypothetical protein